MTKTSLRYPYNLVDKPPYRLSLDVHIISDYIELCCLAHQDGLVSLDDMRNLFELPDQEGIEEDGLPTTLRDAFRCCCAKNRILGEKYPFEARNNCLNLKVGMTDDQYLYIQLLFSSMLTYFQDIQSKLTDTFELISQRALQGFLSPKWDVKIFGKGGHSDPRYTGNTWSRLSTLADDLRLGLSCKEQSFAKTSTGDIGIDIVSWFPFADSAGCLPVILGQCACGLEKWQDKQASVSNSRIRGYLNSSIPHREVILTPTCFRNTQGEWLRKEEIYTLLLDRVRILSLVGNTKGLVLDEVKNRLSNKIDILSL